MIFRRIPVGIYSLPAFAGGMPGALFFFKRLLLPDLQYGVLNVCGNGLIHLTFSSSANPMGQWDAHLSITRSSLFSPLVLLMPILRFWRSFYSARQILLVRGDS